MNEAIKRRLHWLPDERTLLNLRYREVKNILEVRQMGRKI